MRFLKENRAALLLAAAGVVLMMLGAGRGETEIILRKAINICMECIGLG